MNYYFSKQFAEEQAEQDFINYCMKTRKDDDILPVEPEHVAEVLWRTRKRC